MTERVVKSEIIKVNKKVTILIHGYFTGNYNECQVDINLFNIKFM